MTKKAFVQFLSLLFILFLNGIVKAQTIMQLQQGKPTSIRGLSVVDDNVAWISGSKGYVAITRDGGKNWDWRQVKGFEKADFRDIEAFSEKEAVIMSSGTPALVLKTTDGGANWKVKYSNTDTAYFFDAMDFADRFHGYILGDPVNSKFLLLETKNGGETWAPFKNQPNALSGEAAFAASGTCLRIVERSIYIASGGNVARFLTYLPNTNLWDYASLPLLQGKSSQGAFSLAIGKTQGIIMGGDYENDKKSDSISVNYNTHHFTKFIDPGKGPAGFQSCVEFIQGDIFLSTGTPGSNITTDGGKTWTKIDGASYNVCRRAKRGKLVLLAGNGGKIALLKM